MEVVGCMQVSYSRPPDSLIGYCRTRRGLLSDKKGGNHVTAAGEKGGRRGREALRPFRSGLEPFFFGSLNGVLPLFWL